MRLKSTIYKSIYNISTYIAVLVSLIGIFVGLMTSTTLDFQVNNKISSFGIKSEVKQSRIIDLEYDVSVINAQLEGLKELPDNTPVSTKLRELESRIESIEKKLISLNEIIMESPEKALTLPLLKRDIDSLQKQYISTVANLGQHISRAYDIFKWVTGSMFLGVLSLAVGVFLRSKE